MKGKLRRFAIRLLFWLLGHHPEVVDELDDWRNDGSLDGVEEFDRFEGSCLVDRSLDGHGFTLSDLALATRGRGRCRAKLGIVVDDVTEEQELRHHANAIEALMDTDGWLPGDERYAG